MPSPNPPRVYLNEHLSPRLAAQLRRHGFDVISSHDANMLSASDEEQLAFAILERRAVVTFNFNDFVSLHEMYITTNKEHWGIILSTAEPIGVLMQRLLRLLNTLGDEELINQIRWLNEFR